MHKLNDLKLLLMSLLCDDRIEYFLESDIFRVPLQCLLSLNDLSVLTDQLISISLQMEMFSLTEKLIFSEFDILSKLPDFQS